MEQNSAVYGRPDVNGLPPSNKRVPLSQQNKHQQTDQSLNERTSVQNKNILQSQVLPTVTLDRMPLSQMNSHQNVTHVTARPDVNTERQTIVNSNVQRQPINVAPQKNKKHKEVVVPTPHTYTSSSARSNVIVPTIYDAHASQQPNYVAVPTPQENIYYDEASDRSLRRPNSSGNNYAPRHVPVNPPSFFGFLLTIFAVVTLAVIILASSNKRR